MAVDFIVSEEDFTYHGNNVATVTVIAKHMASGRTEMEEGVLVQHSRKVADRLCRIAALDPRSFEHFLATARDTEEIEYSEPQGSPDRMPGRDWQVPR